ncbi:hypothetical protein J4217_04465 [Candidatus Pacearchaeota archaeon]|nr:hypothetical protein [Candidatus Pacearchaeota archaeon]
MTKEVTKTIIKEVRKEAPKTSHHYLNRKIRPFRSNFNNPKPKKLEDKIVENLIELQKVNVNLAEKFDKLTNQISALLGLFENAARSFATSPSIQASDKDREFLEKVDKLLEQNKTIAKGLTLVEERIRERVYGQQSTSSMPMAMEEKPIREEKSIEEFKPSIGRPLPKF